MFCCYLRRLLFGLGFALSRPTWWRDSLSLPFAAAQTDMPQGGFTETAPLSKVDVPLLWQRVDALRIELEPQSTDIS